METNTPLTLHWDHLFLLVADREDRLAVWKLSSSSGFSGFLSERVADREDRLAVWKQFGMRPGDQFLTEVQSLQTVKTA